MADYLERLRDPENPLFQLARLGARLTRLWVIPILLFLFLLAGAAGALFPLETAAEAGLWASTLDTTAFLFVGYLPVVALVFLWVWRWEKRGPLTLGLQLRGAVRYGIGGFALGAGLIVVGMILLLTSGDTTLDFDQSSIQGWAVVLPALIVLAGWTVQGLTEEVIFRGWLLQNTGVQLGPLLGAIVATALFALVHFANPGITLLAAINLVLIGVLFTVMALLEGGIWAASGFHIAWNWVQSNIFGFKVSGLDIGGGSIVRIVPSESSEITGGDFGFEGSVAATVTIVIGILLLLAVSSRVEGLGTSGEAGVRE